MKKYDKCKDSGVAWIGEIPEDWTETKGKYCFDITTGRLDANAEEIDGIYPFFTCSNRIKKINTYAFDCEALLIAGNGDVGYTQYYNGKFNAYQRTYVLRNFSMDIYPIYVKYYFLGLFKQSIKTKFVGSVIDFIKVGDLQNFKICFPRLDRQRDIAHFLDNKLEVIDKIIDDKNDLIIKLKEYCQTIINETVTKGLDKKALMKDSGIDWIGEIPEGWNIKKFKYLFTFNRGLNITKADLIEVGIPCVNYGEIHSKFGFEINPEFNILKFVDKNYIESFPTALLRRGDFIFADTSEDIEGSGNFTCLNSDIPTFAGYHTIVTRQKENHSYRYLSYLFESIKYRNQIRCSVYGVKLFSITQNILKNTLVLLPSKKEQEQISCFLDKKRNEINSTVNSIEQQITKLQEYKKSIISEAVTGKIKIEKYINEGVI